MTDWKPLPGGLASDVRHLVAELRTLKDRAGLSLAVLGGRTPYSKSSWERYLNGKALPPQHAVISLGKLADADPARLVALWELANRAWHDHKADGADGARDADDVHDRPSEESTPSTKHAPATRTEEPPSVSRRFGRRQLIRTVVALAAAVGLSVSLYAAFGRHPGAHTDRDGTASTDAARRQLDVNCFAAGCTGKNPGQTGCGGDAWTAALYKVAGVYVELRYSDACKAAWSRISWGHPGDIARVVGEGGRTYQNKVHYDTDTFSAMVAAPSPSTAKACVLLTSGVHACTAPGGTQHLTEPPNPPTTSVTVGPG
ncbi:helix-turn-helix domain-containing protein [Streptomyces misionensis]|uniref:helix-turn-helix domain-containing protein n=1 Tax=Streptomyces TaxID=1883 RepID=UPI0033A864B2